MGKLLLQNLKKLLDVSHMVNVPELKKAYLEGLSKYPFDNKEEAMEMGIENFVLAERDEFTALESPFTFRSYGVKTQLQTQSQGVFTEDESSEGESTDDNCFYDDIRMDMDLFINGRQIVDGCAVTLTRNGKYGLVGRNGIGKTTLLKAIRKRKFGISKSLKIHMIRQDYVSSERVIDFVGAESGRVLQSLGFCKDQLNQALKDLSGGWRMRAQLAKAIFANPDLLLLDEPTNFLDLKAIAWLEGQIKDMKTVIIVSHDRNFLNNTVDHILHLNDMRVDIYRGNYAAFKEQRDNAVTKQIREYENQKAEREHIQSFIDRFRYNKKASSQAQSRIKLLKKMEVLAMPRVDPVMRFRFKCEVLKGTLVEIEHSSFSYRANDSAVEKRIFDDLSLRICDRDRIVIVGENGHGKSTLLKLLTMTLRTDDGKVDAHPGLRIGYFAQHHVDHLDHNQHALSLLMRAHDEEQSRSALSSFGLNINNQKIGTLSGGQKSRLAFAMMSLQRPNLLILDEPTNHLDMETIDALADALSSFEGAVVCVSHDLAFIEKVFDDVYVCENQRLERFKGTATEYKESLKKH